MYQIQNTTYHVPSTNTKYQVSNNTDLALVTELAHGGVPAVDADPGLGVTSVRVTITLALPTVGEVPVSGLTLRAPPAKRGLVSVALALASLLVTKLILGALTLKKVI